MDLYIDLSVFLLLLLAITIITAIKILNFSSFSKVLVIIFILMHGLFILNIYINPFLANLLFILFNVVFIYLMSKNNKFTNIILYFFFYYGISFILSSFNKGIIFRNSCLLIINSEGILLSLLVPFFGIMMIISSKIIDKTFHLYNYKTKIILTINNKDKIYSSYFDTGNTLKYKNIPVVFLSDSNIEIDKNIFNKSIKINTVAGQKDVFITDALLKKVNSEESYYVYVALINDDKSFSGCDVLLNAYLF